MNGLEPGLRQTALDLSSLTASYALVGGFAVSVRAEPRLTRDADLALAVRSDDEAERFGLDLAGLGYTASASLEHEVDPANGQLDELTSQP